MSGREDFIEDWADDPLADPPPVERPSNETDTADLINGSDQTGMVTVLVTERADVRAVRLAAEWRTELESVRLGSAVRAAFSAAMMKALARQVNDTATASTGFDSVPASAEESPLRTEDVRRLVDAVTTEISELTQRAFPRQDQDVAAESSGGQVTGTARNGRMLSLTIQRDWLDRSGKTEIEHELTDILRTLHRNSTPDSAAIRVPDNSAMAEVIGLLNDPERLLRRTGLTLADGHTHEGEY